MIWFVVIVAFGCAVNAWFARADYRRICSRWDEAIRDNYRHMEEIRHLKVAREQQEQRIRLAAEMLAGDSDEVPRC